LRYSHDGSVIPATLVWQPLSPVKDSPTTIEPRIAPRQVLIMDFTPPHLANERNRLHVFGKASIFLSAQRLARIYWICRANQA
jgi:hypothetical protein